MSHFPLTSLLPFTLGHTQESDILKRSYKLKNWITSTLYIYLNLCKLSPNIIIHLNDTLEMSWNIVCSRSILIENLLYLSLKDVITHFALIPLPLFYTLSLFWSNPLPYKRVTYFLNGPLVFCIIMLFGFISFEVPTLEEILAGIKFIFSDISREIIFAVTTSTKTLQKSNFVVALRNNFFHDPILWFWEINTFYLKKWQKW